MDDNKIVRRRDALADGIADHQLRAMYSCGEWQRLGPGVYVPVEYAASLSASQKHLLQVRALIPSCSPNSVVSHQSAAVLHRLPLTDVELDRVHITQDRRGGGTAKPNVVRHCAPMDAATEVGGVAMTSMARTVVDLARSHTFETAVIAGDEAVKYCTAEDLAMELARARKWKGIAQARRAVSFMDGRSDNPGESRSRIVLAEGGFLGEPQVEIFTAGGLLVGRVDLLFGLAVLGEFDGKLKYTDHARPNEGPGDVVFREKLREDEFRDLGYQMVRWTWADLAKPADLFARLRRAQERAATLPAPIGIAKSTTCIPRCARNS